MVRTVRLNEKGVVYHLISRFVDRNWYIEHEHERELYLRLFGRAVRTSDWRCLAFAVMSNHIHLAMLAGEMPLGLWVRRVHSPFADSLNRGRGRIGSVFVRGPKDRAIPAEHVGTLIAYIHNNPVRAGVVASASESTWTSHRAYLGSDKRPPWLNVALGLSCFGFDRNALDVATAAEHTERKHISLAEIRGRARVRGAIEVATPLATTPVEVPFVARPYAHIRPDPGALIDAACAVLGLSTLQIRSRQTRGDISPGRRVIVHCAHLLGLTGAEIGAALGMSQQAASKLRVRPLGHADQRLVAQIVETVAGACPWVQPR
ncbi:MAG TPA: hypothetical protein VL326_31395 [Kofleriaceae bacterium]|jgi:hypothetical protein|nr:hypothetical protein [Kofleriaceae bacterium]